MRFTIADKIAVSLFTREWIEILSLVSYQHELYVSLFTREWIEISKSVFSVILRIRLPLYEGVD